MTESTMTFALQQLKKGAISLGGKSPRKPRLGFRNTFMRSALVTSAAMSPTNMLYSMALSTGAGSFPIAVLAFADVSQSSLMGRFEFGRRMGWAELYAAGPYCSTTWVAFSFMEKMRRQ